MITEIEPYYNALTDPKMCCINECIHASKYSCPYASCRCVFCETHKHVTCMVCKQDVGEDWGKIK